MLRKIYLKVKNLIEWRQRMVSYGDANQDIRFFVLRRYALYNGIASNIIVVLGLLRYMEKCYPNAIPVVDFWHCTQSFADDEDINAWELFFQQPNKYGYGMEEVLQSKNVILSDGLFERKGFCELPDLKPYRRLVDEGWEQLFYKYIHLKEELVDEFEREWELLSQGEIGNIIGVKYRGTDYVTTKPKGHYVQPSLEEMKSIVDSYIDDGFTYVFLATEDKDALNYFATCFGSKLLFIKKNFLPYHGKEITSIFNTTKVSKTKTTYDYLKELYFLSKCDGFISGKSSGILLSILWNRGKFKRVHIFDHGKY